MRQNILKVTVLFLLLFISISSINSQSQAKKMIKRSLHEKSFMKLNNNYKIEKNSNGDKIELRDGFGEKLVRDDEKGSESELFAVINPSDSNNIVVGVIHFAYTQLEQPLSISIYFSNDFGNSWNKSEFDGTIDPDAFTIGGGDPVLVYDADGKLHLTYLILSTTDLFTFQSKEFVYHAVSEDNGITWKAEPYFESTLFNPVDLGGIDRFLDKQWMIADTTGGAFHGNVYMGYVDFYIGDTTGTESISMKVDVLEPGDTSFTFDPVNVTTDSFKFVQYASVDLDKQGNFYLGFVGSYDSLNYNFYNCVSTDGAKTFSEPRKISGLYFPGFTVDSESSSIVGIKNRYFPSPYIAIDKSEDGNPNRIYATWTCPGIDTIEITGSDIYLCYSDDKGVTWTEPMIVNNDNLADSDQFYSSLEVNSKGIPILCFYDKRNDTTYNFYTDYYITYSTELDDLDFSLQFPMTKESSNFSKIGLKTNGFGIGEYNKMVSTATSAIPFWSDGRQNDGDVDVYMAIIPLDGKDYSVGLQEIHLVSDKIAINSICPNPNKGVFSLKLELKRTSDLSFQIFNLEGQKVYQEDWGRKNSGTYNADFNISNLISGNYIIKINSDYGFSTRKIIIDN